MVVSQEHSPPEITPGTPDKEQWIDATDPRAAVVRVGLPALADNSPSAVVIAMWRDAVQLLDCNGEVTTATIRELSVPPGGGTVDRLIGYRTPTPTAATGGEGYALALSSDGEAVVDGAAKYAVLRDELENLLGEDEDASDRELLNKLQGRLENEKDCETLNESFQLDFAKLRKVVSVKGEMPTPTEIVESILAHYAAEPLPPSAYERLRKAVKERAPEVDDTPGDIVQGAVSLMDLVHGLTKENLRLSLLENPEPTDVEQLGGDAFYQAMGHVRRGVVMARVAFDGWASVKSGELDEAPINSVESAWEEIDSSLTRLSDQWLHEHAQAAAGVLVDGVDEDDNDAASNDATLRTKLVELLEVDADETDAYLFDVLEHKIDNEADLSGLYKKFTAMFDRMRESLATDLKHSPLGPDAITAFVCEHFDAARAAGTWGVQAEVGVK